MKEWSEQDKFSSYNSWKMIFYEKWFRSIVAWYKNPDYKILPPLEASMDLSPNGNCNLRCRWCNCNKYLNKTSAISDEKVMETINFLLDWKIPSFCIGGGGDSTLRKNLPEVLELIKKKGSASGIATNGTLFNDKLIDAMANCCRWVGVSVDAANSKTFKDTKGVDLLPKVFTNMRKLVKKTKEVDTLCEVSYKFLVTPWNYKEVYDACKIAKDIGVKDFYCRMADLSHQGMGEKKVKDYDFMVEEILAQFDKCHTLRTDKFRVFTSTHKFNADFKPKKPFRQCWAMPLLIQCCPDGNVYGCVDQRLQPYYKLGSYMPDPKKILEFWGSKKHWELTFKEGFKRCTSRCTFTAYCEACEKLFIEEDRDIMCRYFT